MTQNRRAYLLRRAKTKSPFTAWNPPELSPLLVELARKPFVARDCNKGDEIELDLGIWSIPYQITIPEDLQEDQINVEILNFYHWGMMIDAGNERMKLATEDGMMELAAKLKEELANRLEEWTKEWEVETPGGVAGILWEVAMHWSAKSIAVLHRELEVCLAGESAYLGAYGSQELAWQNLNWSRGL